MPPRSKIDQLPDEVRADLERMIIDGHFSRYVAISKWLKGMGFDIGKSAVGEYGYNLQRKLSAIKASTEAARMIADAAPDDSDDRSAAVISLTQTGLFNILVALEEAGSADDPMQRAKLLSAVAKNVATLTRASVGLKKFRFEVTQRVKSAADRAASIAKKGGLTASAVNTIRREILGIAA
jgi:hypothetical protein